jgi:hypothetical protein
MRHTGERIGILRIGKKMTPSAPTQRLTPCTYRDGYQTQLWPAFMSLDTVAGIIGEWIMRITSHRPSVVRI